MSRVSILNDLVPFLVYVYTLYMAIQCTGPFYSLDTYRHFLMPLQQMTFKIMVTKEEIAQYEQLLHLPQCFQLHLIIMLAFTEFPNLCGYDFKVVCCIFALSGKGLK